MQRKTFLKISDINDSAHEIFNTTDVKTNNLEDFLFYNDKINNIFVFN